MAEEVKEVQVPTEKPARLSPFPISMRPETKNRFLSIFPKGTDEAISQLLDAYENKGTGTAVTDEKIAEQNAALQEENTRLRTDLKSAQESVQKNTVRITELEQALQQNNPSADAEKLQTVIEELKQKNSELTEQFESAKSELIKVNRQTGSDSSAIKELQDKLGAAIEQQKQDRKVIEGLQEVKKNAEKMIADKDAEIAEMKDAFLKMDRGENVQINMNHFAEGDILHYFPNTCAKLLQATCEKLTARRKDGMTVTPAMLLSDMFLRYTIDRWNNWFYSFVLSDTEIVEIAKEENERLTDVKMVRAALGIR